MLTVKSRLCFYEMELFWSLTWSLQPQRFSNHRFNLPCSLPPGDHFPTVSIFHVFYALQVQLHHIRGSLLSDHTVKSRVKVNTSSCHPSHVPKKIPKEQFIRLRRMFTKIGLPVEQWNLCKRIIECRFHEKEFKKTIKQVAKMDRNELERERIRENKDPQTIIVTTWNSTLSTIPSCILKNNFHLISSDPKLSKFFTQKPSVAYWTNKSLSDHLLKNDIANQQLHPNVASCGKYKLCPQTYTAKIITNDKVTITEKIKGTGNCKERVIMFLYIKGLIYWTYRKTTFTALLQTSLRHQKQITQQRTCKIFSRKS